MDNSEKPNMVANRSMEKTKGVSGVESTATLDDAMALTGIGLYNILHTLMSGLILMGVIMQNLVLGYVLPAAQCDLDLTLQQRGWLGAIPFVAIILTSHFWGWLADTRGRKPVMQYSMIVSAFFSILNSFSFNIIVFAILQFLSAIFTAGSSSVGYTYLGEFSSLRHKDKLVAFGASFVGIGTVVLPALSWGIFTLDLEYPISFLNIVYRPWRLLLIAATIPYILSSVFLIFAPESPKFLIAMDRQVACHDVIKKMYTVNKRKPAESFPVKTIISEGSSEVAGLGFRSVLVSMRDQTTPLFKLPLLPWTCLTCFVQFGIFSATNGFYLWFPTILNALANHDGGTTRICDILDATRVPVNTTDVFCDDSMKTDTFEWSIYIGLVFCSMYIIVGFLVDYIGKKLILLIVLGGAGLCCIGAHLAHNQQVGVILFAIFQMSGACIGLMTAVTVELFPTKYRAMAISLSMMMGRLGSVMGSNLIGLFLDVNCGASFYLFGGLLIVCSALTLTLPGRKKNNIRTKQMSAEPTGNERNEPA